MHRARHGTTLVSSCLSDDFVPDTGEAPVARIWVVDDREMGAELVSVFGDRVVLKDERGRQHRIPTSRLSDYDLEHLELERAPEFNLSFTRKSDSAPGVCFLAV